MRKRIVKVKEFIKKNYKILIPIIAIVVLLLAFLLYLRVYKYNRYTEDKKVAVYQSFLGIKYKYDVIITTDRKDIIKNIEPVGLKINMDSIPIYYQDEDKIIFPSEMALVFPMRQAREYSLFKYSLLSLDNNNFYISTTNFYKSLSYFFLYDYNDLYFFIDDVTLTVGSDEIYLSPMSYVIVKTSNSVEYYDKESDSAKLIEITNEDVYAENEYLKINLKEDYVYYQNNIALLSPNSDNLNTIDMMEDY